jgi:hypothetical protein
MADDYVRVTVTLSALSPDAVFLEMDGGEIGGWVPRSCLYGPDETELCLSMIGDQIEIGIL